MNNNIGGHFNNIQDVITLLNISSVAYAVLRNYDNLLEDDIYMDGHGDIDLICADSRKLASILNAIDHPGHVKNCQGNGTHYLIYINNIEVSLDLRHIGDGYYCEKWEQEILERRREHNSFYVLSEEDYFYTLIYHAIFQKHYFSKNYRFRLRKMGEGLGIKIQDNSIEFYVSLLEKHMRQNHYHYEYPKDKYVPLKRQHIQDKSLFVMHYSRYFEHILFETKINTIKSLVEIKHKFLK